MKRLLLPALLAAVAAAPAPAGPAREASVLNLLQSRRLSLKLEKGSLDDLVKHLRAATGINIFVSKARIEKDGGDVDAIEIDVDVKDVAAGELLKLALEGHGLGLKIQGSFSLPELSGDSLHQEYVIHVP